MGAWTHKKVCRLTASAPNATLDILWFFTPRSAMAYVFTQGLFAAMDDFLRLLILYDLAVLVVISINPD